MKLIAAYDSWVLAKVEAILDWLNEWLYISKKTVERFLMTVYVFGSLMDVIATALRYIPIPVWLVCVLQGWLFFGMIVLHVSPSTTRTAFNRLWWVRPNRISLQIISIIAVLPPYSHHVLVNISRPIWQIAFTLFFCVVATDSDSERGRKAKIALAKLKGLFSWLPDPVPEGA